MKVLIIEDEDFIRDIYKRQLDLAGIPTDGAAGGQAGLDALNKSPYDLVLLDIMLPDINGLQILKTIKQNPATKNIPVMMLTNLGQDTVIKEGFDLGADAYLIKASYTPDQVVQEVKKVLASKQSQPVVSQTSERK
ncbi:response regulator [Candidatus Daviesbacteria bacterium]|nr:response regulator [Candidatus Daviesbacteria bacterium]